MILGILFGIALLTVPLFRGSISRIGELRLSHIGTVVAALMLQFLIVTIVPASFPMAAAAVIHLMSYGLTLIFVWHNRSIPGIAVLVAGGLMNLTAIAANGGVMPASPEALVLSGKADLANDAEFNNSTVQDNARLQILGDIFAIPDGYPFANVFSLGDIFLVLGGAIIVHRVGGSALGRAGKIDPRRRVAGYVPDTSDAYKLNLLDRRRRPPGPAADAPKPIRRDVETKVHSRSRKRRKSPAPHR